MYTIYSPNILQRIMSTIEEARLEGSKIERIVVTEREWQELCNIQPSLLKSPTFCPHIPKHRTGHCWIEETLIVVGVV